MALESVAVAVFVIIAVFVVHKLLQEAIDIVHIGITVLSLALTLGMVLLVLDAVSFKRNFSGSESIVAVSSGSSLSGAFRLNQGKAAWIEGTELDSLSEKITAKDYGSALGKSYKLVILRQGLMNISEASQAQPALESALSNPFRFSSLYRKEAIYIYPEPKSMLVLRYIPGPILFGRIKQSFGFQKNETA